MTDQPTAPRTFLVERERVSEALRTLPRPGALDEAIVTTVAEAYADGRLVLAETAASVPAAPAAGLLREAINEALRWLNMPGGGVSSAVGNAIDVLRAALAATPSPEPEPLDVPFTAIGELLAHSVTEVEEGRYECRLCDADVSARKSKHAEGCEWLIVRQWVARLSRREEPND